MKDNFSKHAAIYATYRPVYPKALYDFLYGHVKENSLAWDAGTGNGQVASVLSQHFKRVLATDISEAQLSHATFLPNIKYIKGAEQIPELESQSVSLITVAQAIHWFNRELFYEEVKRVAKPGALLAVWCYQLMQVNAEIDALVNEFYTTTIGSYWDSERKLVDTGYQTINFPFEEIAAPPMFIEVKWSITELEGYLNSWSAVQHFIRANGYNPVPELMSKVMPLWNDTMAVSFPLRFRVGCV